MKSNSSSVRGSSNRRNRRNDPPSAWRDTNINPPSLFEGQATTRNMIEPINVPVTRNPVIENERVSEQTGNNNEEELLNNNRRRRGGRDSNSRRRNGSRRDLNGANNAGNRRNFNNDFGSRHDLRESALRLNGDGEVEPDEVRVRTRGGDALDEFMEI